MPAHAKSSSSSALLEEAELAAIARRKAAAHDVEVHAAELAGAARRKARTKLLAAATIEAETWPTRRQGWSAPTKDLTTFGSNSAWVAPKTVPPDDVMADNPFANARRSLRRTRTSYTAPCSRDNNSAPWPIDALAHLRPTDERPPSKVALTSAASSPADKSELPLRSSTALSAAAAAFATFLGASKASRIVHAYASLLATVEIEEEGASIAQLATRLLPSLPPHSRFALLLDCLEAKASRPHYHPHQPREPQPQPWGTGAMGHGRCAPSESSMLAPGSKLGPGKCDPSGSARVIVIGAGPVCDFSKCLPTWVILLGGFAVRHRARIRGSTGRGVGGSILLQSASGTPLVGVDRARLDCFGH